MFLLSFVAIWNNFFLPLVMLSTPKYYPLTLGLAHWNYLECGRRRNWFSASSSPVLSSP